MLWLKDSNRLIMLKTFLEIDLHPPPPPPISAFLEMIFLFHISNVTSNRQVYLCANFKMIEIATSQPKTHINGKYSNKLLLIPFLLCSQSQAPRCITLPISLLQGTQPIHGQFIYKGRQLKLADTVVIQYIYHHL